MGLGGNGTRWQWDSEDLLRARLSCSDRQVLSRLLYFGFANFLTLMRVGRPVPLPPQPVCEYCGANAKLTRFGDDPYPYRDDHGPLWVCAPCQAWIGVFARSARNVPLGRLANAELREWKGKLHSALEPMAEAKVRRDGGKIFAARAKGFKWLAGLLSIEEQKCSIHLLDVDQCKAAVAIIARFELERRLGHSGDPSSDSAT
jgi:hypothetical protein